MDWQLETSWGEFPPAKNAYKANWFTELWKIYSSIREKKLALGVYIWPPNSAADQFYWGQGNVGTINNQNDGTFLLTDGTTPANNWATTGAPGFTGKVYAGGSSPDTKYRPTSFDVIISFDDFDPRKQIRAQITDNTAGDFDMDGNVITRATLTIRSYQDYVVAGFIDGISPPDGAKFYIIERGREEDGKGLWWADINPKLSRTPDFPNGFQDDFGDVSQGEVDFALINNFDPLFKAPMLYATDALKGKEFVVFGEDGFLHRIAITGNEVDGPTGKNKVKFAKQTFKVVSSFSIVPPGTVVWPGRQLCPPFIDYTGRKTNYYVHAPSSPSPPIVHPVVATDFIRFSDGDDEAFCPDCDMNPGDCTHDAFTDTSGPLDVWSSIQNVCGGAPLSSNKSYTPWYFKSLCSIQATIEAILFSFVPPLDYPVEGRNPKQNFTPALLFDYAKINNGTSVVLDKDGSGNYHAVVDSKYNGFGVYYTILKPSVYGKEAGIERQSGQATVSDGLINLGGDLHDQDDVDIDPSLISDVGSQVFWSAGWTRYYPKMFRFMYDASAFIPDSDAAHPPTVYYPPSIDDFSMFGCFGAGQWIKRPKSTSLMTFDARGIVGGGPAFAEGDLAVYMGESYNYPTSTETLSDGDDGTIRYYDRMSEIVNLQRPYADTQEKIVNQSRGAIQTCNLYSFTDDTKHWFTSWWGGGTGHTESGTATQAGATFIQDTSKATGEPNCWWKADRFLAYAFPYEGFVIEIDHNSGDGLKTYKMPITFVDPTIVRVEFDSIGMTFEVSDAYRILEPDTILNRYADKTVTIKTDLVDPTDPTKLFEFDLNIIQNDDNTLYFDPAEIVQECPTGLESQWSYTINEFYPGGTYKYSGGKWTIPTGVDSRVDGRMFRPTPEENAADWVKSYGHCRKYDYPINSNSDGVLAEIRRALDSMFLTKQAISWVKSTTDTPEPYLNFSLDGEDYRTFPRTPQDAWNGVKAFIDAEYASGVNIATDAGSLVAPNKNAYTLDVADYNADGTRNQPSTDNEVGGGIGAETGYARINTIAGFMLSKRQFFMYATFDDLDSDLGLYIDSDSGFNYTATDKQFNPFNQHIEFRKWVKFDETGPSNSEVDYSNALRDLESPGSINFVEAPFMHLADGSYSAVSEYSVTQRWWAYDQIALIDWRPGMKFKGPAGNTTGFLGDQEGWDFDWWMI